MMGSVRPSSLKRLPERERLLPEVAEALPQGAEVPRDGGEVLPQGGGDPEESRRRHPSSGGVRPERTSGAGRGARDIPGTGGDSMGMTCTHIHALNRGGGGVERSIDLLRGAWRTGGTDAAAV